MRKISTTLVAGLALAAGCKESPVSPPVDAPTSDALQGALTRSGLQTLALGVINADRGVITGSSNAYLVLTSIFQRDLYRIDASEPRYVTETLGGTPDAGSFAGGAGPWNNAYVATRAATALLQALPGASTDQVSAAEKSATAGFIKTFKALDHYRVLEMRDSIGAVIQGADPNAVDPIRCKPNVINYVAALLDSALTDLNAAGATSKLPFAVPTGLQAAGPGGVDYTVVSNIIKLNRGLKGKVDVYRALLRPAPVAGAATAAITELTTFLGGAAPGAVPANTFSQGAYVTFVAGGTENTPNPFADARLALNPKVAATTTTPGAFGGILAGDTRASKFVARTPALAGNGLSSGWNLVYTPTTTANQTRPIAILRVEEAVLLRAQAYIESGDIANGMKDLNSVHRVYNAGADFPTAVTTAAQARQALLYEKRYSLIGEGPQLLVDLRAYGLLKAGSTPAELPTDPFNTAFPIPKGEADTRGGAAAIQLTCN